MATGQLESEEGYPNHHQNTIRVRAQKNDRDDITDFNQLRDKVTKKLKLDNWVVVSSSRSLYIFNLDRKPNGNLSIVNTITIDDDLTAKVFYDENRFDSLTLFRWPQLQMLVEQFRCNLKREDEFQFDCVGERKVKIEFQNCGEGTQEQGVALFEFCAVNLAGSTETKNEQTVQSVDQIGASVPFKIKNEPLTTSVEDTPLPFKCSECDKAYDQRVRLLIHQRTHQPRVCPICNEHFTGRVDRHVHSKNIPTTSSPICFICYVCGRVRKNKASLENHMSIAHYTGAVEFHCDICKDTKFGSRIDIEWHMKCQHNNEGKNVEHMQMEYVRVRREKFEKQTTSDDPNRPMGDKELPTPSLIGANDSIRHTTKRKLKQCPTCDKFFTNLSVHMTKHSPVGHICDICGSTLTSRSAVKMHVQRMHSDSENLCCDICNNGQVFHSRANLRRHLAGHAGATAKRMDGSALYQCEHCKEHFPSKYTLQGHTTLHHSDAPQFKCQHCGKMFGYRSLLNSHEKLHSGILHNCQVCGESFKHPKYLKKHLKRHDQIPPKKPCTMCDKQYANGFDLRTHMRKVHGVVVVPSKRVYVKKIPVQEK